MIGAILTSIFIICFVAFLGSYFFWSSSYSAHVMSKFLPTVCGFLSLLGGPLLAMFYYVLIIPHHGAWAILGLPFCAIIVLSAAIFGFMVGRSFGPTAKGS